MKLDPTKFGNQLHKAAYAGNLHKVKALLDAGAPIDASNPYGETPLMGAACHGQIEICQLLIDRYAQVENEETCRSFLAYVIKQLKTPENI